uniref:AlkB homolog 8, tRNA methyltransferase n=1 Tax=Oryzias sinensis TaxID=183150 RepID=A0A8C8DZX1_9TELE
MKSDLSTESRKSKEEKKVLRKQLKASHTLLKHEGVCTTPQPTKSLVIANGGLGNGVSREELTAALQEMGEVEKLLMPPHKPYAFVTFRYTQHPSQRKHAPLPANQVFFHVSKVKGVHFLTITVVINNIYSIDANNLKDLFSII